MAENDKNIEAVNNWFQAANSHEIEKIMDTLNDDYQYIFNDKIISGREEVFNAWKLYLEGIPDINFSPVKMLSDNDTVAARVRVTGTNKGAFRFMGMNSLDKPIPAANDKIDYEEASFFTVKDGKISVLRSYWDTALLKKQMGD